MHFFEWLRQIFVLVLMSKRIINLKFPLLWMNWCLLKLFIFIMIYEKVGIAKIVDLAKSKMMIIYNLSLWYFALCGSSLTLMHFNLIGWTWQHSHIVNLGDRECLSLKTHKFVDVHTSSQIFIFLCFGAFFPGCSEGSLCVGFSGPTVHHLLPSSQSCTTVSLRRRT